MGPMERLQHFSTVRQVATDHVGETIHAALLAGMTARDIRAAIRWQHEEVRLMWLLWVEDLADAGGLPPYEDLFQASLRLLAERELYRVLVDARRPLPDGVRESAEARLELIAAFDRTAAERIDPFEREDQDDADAT